MLCVRLRQRYSGAQICFRRRLAHPSDCPAGCPCSLPARSLLPAGRCWWCRCRTGADSDFNDACLLLRQTTPMLRVFRAALTAPSRLAELLVFCRARVVYRTHAPDLPIAATHSSGVIDSYPIHP